MGKACGTYGKEIKSYWGLLERKKGMRQLGTPRHRWEDNTKIDLMAVGCESVEWNNFLQHRVKWGLLRAVMNIRRIS